MECWPYRQMIKVLKLHMRSLNRGQRWWWCVDFVVVATVEGHAQPRGESRARAARAPAQPNIVHRLCECFTTRAAASTPVTGASIISHSIQLSRTHPQRQRHNNHIPCTRLHPETPHAKSGNRRRPTSLSLSFTLACRLAASRCID